MSESEYPCPVGELLTHGKPKTRGTEWFEYVSLGIGPEHAPELIRMATDEALNQADPDSSEVWAPLHAWRALGQLRAEAAVRPLLNLLHFIDKHYDDWVAAELPVVYGMIGPVAVPELTAYLDDASHGQWARTAAGQALEHIARKHPEARDVCIAALTRQLERFSGHDPVFSANLVVSLVELDAVEAAPLIERAFAADAVELTVMGDWEDVQVELGLKEERESPRPRFGWVEDVGDVGDVGDEPSDMEEQERYLARQQQKQSEQNRKRKAKTKRKQRRASRKKNR